MVNRMTSWTLNILIVVTTAFVVILPDPAEIRSAFEYRNSQRPMVIIDTAADNKMVMVAETQVAASRSIIIEQDEAVECLRMFENEGQEAILNCIPKLTAEVARFDRMAEVQQNLDVTVYADPEVEQMRSAVAKLCRTAWSSGMGVMDGEDNTACQTVTQGIAY